MSTTRSFITILASTAVTAATILASAPAATTAQAAPAKLTPAAGAHATNGWSAILLARKAYTGPASLVLVSPTGKQYSVRAGLGDNLRIADVSNDGRRVLLEDVSATVPNKRNSHSLLDTRTGAISGVKGYWEGARFTNPSGQALLVTPVKGQMQRVDLRGNRKATFAGTTQGSVAPSPDGLFVVAQGPKGKLQVNANASGKVLRTLTTPKGMKSCSVGHFSDNTHFTASCFNGRAEQVYRYSIKGGSPVALTAKLNTRGAFQWGYNDSWATPAGQVVSAVSPCGASRLGLVKGKDSISFRTRTAGSVWLGVIGTSAYYWDNPECDINPSTVSRYDIRSKRNTVLAGTGMNKGMVVRDVALVDNKA